MQYRAALRGCAERFRLERVHTDMFRSLPSAALRAAFVGARPAAGAAGAAETPPRARLRRPGDGQSAEDAGREPPPGRRPPSASPARRHVHSPPEDIAVEPPGDRRNCNVSFSLSSDSVGDGGEPLAAAHYSDETIHHDSGEPPVAAHTATLFLSAGSSDDTLQQLTGDSVHSDHPSATPTAVEASCAGPKHQSIWSFQGAGPIPPPWAVSRPRLMFDGPAGS
ncbi:unnamed protein product [Prorocentrum cordatum]|uniref:Uncharacterized protein n=1 Tax=Prorocentrum cordatum TaxID=2364126 RepID=A0ABN9UXX9_9DINO|nr:unnamed protein product [Polarella glacialis]